jgi:hypothetical protein
MTSPLALPGLLCFWDFQGDPAQALNAYALTAHALTAHALTAQGPYPYRLEESDGALAWERDGVFGPQSIRLGSGAYLALKRGDCPALDLHGTQAQVSLVAWVKRLPNPEPHPGCEAVAGMWNEHGKRQYALFLNLQIHDSAEQVGAHVSSIGGPTPGYRYCMDAAIGATPVPRETWQCIGMTYDGTEARAYLNGALDERGSRNPYRYPGGIYTAGAGGADFTVGAVNRPAYVDELFMEHGSVVANRFYGLLGGLAAYSRALSAKEMQALAAPISQDGI